MWHVDLTAKLRVLQSQVLLPTPGWCYSYPRDQDSFAMPSSTLQRWSNVYWIELLFPFLNKFFIVCSIPKHSFVQLFFQPSWLKHGVPTIPTLKWEKIRQKRCQSDLSSLNPEWMVNPRQMCFLECSRQESYHPGWRNSRISSFTPISQKKHCHKTKCIQLASSTRRNNSGFMMLYDAVCISFDTPFQHMGSIGSISCNNFTVSPRLGDSRDGGEQYLYRYG